MKTNKLIGLLFIALFMVHSGTLLAQNDEFDQISKIVKAGNAKDLVKFFSSSVELNIDGEEATYSIAQAEAVLKSFFSKSMPESFVINHKGASKGGLPYAIGEYINTAGTYRVWIRLRTNGEKYLVYEMSFIEER